MLIRPNTSVSMRATHLGSITHVTSYFSADTTNPKFKFYKKSQRKLSIGSQKWKFSERVSALKQEWSYRAAVLLGLMGQVGWMVKG